MNNTRRNFIKTTALTTGALAVNSMFANSLLTDWDGIEAKRIKHFGLQFWTLRDELFKGTDPKGLLKQVAAAGYGHIESFDGAKGMFWGMKNTEFKKFLTDIGMTIHSSHCNLEENADKKINEAAEIGMKYLIYPWEGPSKTADDYKKLAEKFNKWGDACNKAGIRFAFHNHDYTFKPMNGQFMQDVLMQNTDAGLVDYQMDIFWVVAAGHDPEEWFKKYPNRFRLSHVKDRSKTPDKEEGKNSVELGTGTINWKKILKTARENGMQYYIVEQEAYPNGTPLQAVQINAAFMKKTKA
jgi:sugar phosphate isomerase/epimerase